MKVLTKTLAVLGLALAAMTTTSQAGHSERVRLDLNRHVKGQGTIYLKQELRRQVGLRAANFDLDSVRVIAKSRHGQGTVELMVNNRSQDFSRVNGHPRDFHENSPRSFDRIELENYARRDRGPWQIQVRGNVIVRAVVLILSEEDRFSPDPFPPHRPTPPVRPAPPSRPAPPLRPLPPGRRHGQLVTVDLGTEKVDKFISEIDTFRLSGENVQTLTLEGIKEKTLVESVLVHYSNGRVDRLYELEGTLKKNRVKQAHLAGRRVEKVVVTATSQKLFGSRAKYGVSAEVLR